MYTKTNLFSILIFWITTSVVHIFQKKTFRIVIMNVIERFFVIFIIIFIFQLILTFIND